MLPVTECVPYSFHRTLQNPLLVPASQIFCYTDYYRLASGTPANSTMGSPNTCSSGHKYGQSLASHIFWSLWICVQQKRKKHQCAHETVYLFIFCLYVFVSKGNRCGIVISGLVLLVSFSICEGRTEQCAHSFLGRADRNETWTVKLE